MEMKTTKIGYVLLEAFLVSLFLFSLGIFIGVVSENSVSKKVSEDYIANNLKMDDIRLQSDIMALGLMNCDEAIQRDIEFADEIYAQSIKIAQYEETNKLTEKLVSEHRKYDILRAILWVNTLKIKEQCPNRIKTIVYIYQYNEPGVEKRSEQGVFSNILEEIKGNLGNKVILIPFAGDNNVTSINYLMNAYNITQLPTILIDEKIKITEIQSVEEIEKYLY
jgi:hypothetical protein